MYKWCWHELHILEHTYLKHAACVLLMVGSYLKGEAIWYTKRPSYYKFNCSTQYNFSMLFCLSLFDARCAFFCEIGSYQSIMIPDRVIYCLSWWHMLLRPAPLHPHIFRWLHSYILCMKVSFTKWWLFICWKKRSTVIIMLGEWDIDYLNNCHESLCLWCTNHAKATLMQLGRSYVQIRCRLP